MVSIRIIVFLVITIVFLVITIVFLILFIVIVIILTIAIILTVVEIIEFKITPIIESIIVIPIISKCSVSIIAQSGQCMGGSPVPMIHHRFRCEVLFWNTFIYVGH